MSTKSRYALNALQKESRNRMFMRKTPFLEWDRGNHHRRHRAQIREMRAAIDNKGPDGKLHKQLNVKRAQLEESRLRKIERENHALLHRLRHIARAKTEFCCRPLKPLSRGEAFTLPKPGAQRSLVINYERNRKGMGASSYLKKSLQQQAKLLKSVEALQFGPDSDDHEVPMGQKENFKQAIQLLTRPHIMLPPEETATVQLKPANNPWPSQASWPVDPPKTPKGGYQLPVAAKVVGPPKIREVDVMPSFSDLLVHEVEVEGGEKGESSKSKKKKK